MRRKWFLFLALPVLLCVVLVGCGGLRGLLRRLLRFQPRERPLRASPLFVKVRRLPEESSRVVIRFVSPRMFTSRGLPQAVR